MLAMHRVKRAGISAVLLVGLSLVAGFALSAGVLVLVKVAEPAAHVASFHGGVSPVALKPLAIPSRMYDDKGDQIAVLSDSDYRQPVSLTEVPMIVQDAILDVEDNTFYETGPLDLKGILRAAREDVGQATVLQGGSTITQQLVKTDLLTQQRTASRKLEEAVLSIRLAQQLSKQQILQRYLNVVYFGNGAYGVEAASLTYFDKPVTELDAAQAALLAVMIENPSAYDPIQHPQASRDRRNLALQQMVDNHSITPAQADAAASEPLPSAIHPLQAGSRNAFVNAVIDQLLDDPRLGPTPEARYTTLYEGGLTIDTSYDPTLQAEANAAVAAVLPQTGGQFTASLVAMDPSNGEVRAIVSGNPSSSGSGYDVATGQGGTGRPAGSSFKVFTLLTALEHNISPESQIDGTDPCTFDYPGLNQPYVAHNAEQGEGVMTIREATAQSINCAYIRLALDVGLGNVRATAQALGITTPIPQGAPSIAIGTPQVDPLEMAEAYSVFADGGILHQARFVSEVTGPGGKVLIAPPGPGTRVAPANDIAVADNVLQNVVQYGTGTAASLYYRPVAGKTGTTDSETDAWFDGFTPQLVASVWMGDPRGEVSMTPPATPIAVFGGSYPAEVFHAFMSQALINAPVDYFPSPSYYTLSAATYIYPPYSPGTITPQQVYEQELQKQQQSTTTTTRPGASTTTTTAPGAPPNNGGKRKHGG